MKSEITNCGLLYCMFLYLAANQHYTLSALALSSMIIYALFNK